MKRSHVVLAVGVVLTACLLVPLAGTAAGPRDVTCPQDTHTFTGSARDLTVPAGGFCAVTGATITHDLIQEAEAGAAVTGSSIGHDVVFADFAGADITDTTVGHDIVAGGEESGAEITDTTIGHDFVASGFDSGAGFTDSAIGHDFVGRGEESGADILRTTIGHDVRLLGGGGGVHMESVTIGHDFVASKPRTIQTGHNAPSTPGGPVKVGHDVVIDGAPDLPFVFDGLCNLTVERDLRITNRSVNLGMGVGANCVTQGQQTNTIGRDLVMTGNSALSGFFGPSSINVVGNQVGRDLVFSGNTAVPGGGLEVSGNVAARDATCSANSPAVTVNVPNTAGGSNTCG